MRFFLPTMILASCGLLLLPAWREATAQESAEQMESEEGELSTAEELHDAQVQLHLAQLRLAAMLTQHNYNMLLAQTAVDAARTSLAMFEQFDAENESATKQLDLDYAKDGLADSIEELNQLSVMYERNALASDTAQIVMERAERSIQRQKAAVELQERSLSAWNAMGHANRQKELVHDTLLAQADLEATISGQELEVAEQEAEMVELEKTIKELKAELAANQDDEDMESEG
jgi:hypothetical protein